MNIDYKFKDGVTVPLKIIANHYVDGGYKRVFIYAVLRDNYVETPTDVPLNATELAEFGVLFQCMIRGLAQVTSEEFLTTPLIAIGQRFEGAGE